jgi:NifU-like protein involved in Fe-S cluster formation
VNPAAPRYSDAVRALFRDLPGAGDLAAGGGVAVSGEAAALDRGAWVRLAARIEEGRFAQCRFRAFGCPHTLAAASWVAGRLSGAPLAAAASLDARAIAQELDVPAEKMGRLLVVEDALRGLLDDLRRVQ